MAKDERFIDFYQVLQVWPTASETAIKKAYFSLAKLHHPDVAGKNGGANESVDFKLINEAYAVLSDPGRRREYDEQMRRLGQKHPSGKPEKDRRSAHLAYEQARTAMKHNRYDKAVVLLKSAIKYDDSNPAYHSWYGFALGALKTRLHEARDACKRALEMEFYNADFHANLGYVYYQAGLKSTASECFREALNWDPDHGLALKYLKMNEKDKGKGLIKTLRSLFGGASEGPEYSRKA